MSVVMGDETRVGDPLLGMSQGYLLIPGCLVLGGGLQGGGRGHGREVLAGGGGVLGGWGAWPIHMGDVGGHATGRGWLLPFVEGRGLRQQQWWPVQRGRVRRGPVCGLGVWVCWRADRDVVLRNYDGEEVVARAEHVRQVSNRDVVLLHGRVDCDKGRRGCCRVEGCGVFPGLQVDRVPVRVF